MNVLAGSLYGTPIAVPFIAVASTVGSSGSFWLSRLLLKVTLSMATLHQHCICQIMLHPMCCLEPEYYAEFTYSMCRS